MTQNTDTEKQFIEWVKKRDDDWWDEARLDIWDFRIMREFFATEQKKDRHALIQRIREEEFIKTRDAIAQAMRLCAQYMDQEISKTEFKKQINNLTKSYLKHESVV